LEDADAELRAGNPTLALARLSEHAAKYPTGALSEEREGIRAIALCRAGRAAEGRAAADRFLSSTRKASLAARVRTACNVEKPGE
jgi:outer membrane protein assembly factor BamD (BamD/ComL family)